MLSFRDMKGLLQQRAPELARALAPQGAQHGAYWSAKNPTRADRKPGSLVIWTRGAAPGAWKEYADDASGDVIDLICYLALGRQPNFSRDDRIDAVRWAEGWLGLDTRNPAQIATARREANARQRAAERAEALRRHERARRAYQCWLDGTSMLGSLAEVYLAARGIDYRAIPQREDSLRFRARLDYFFGGHTGPAMVAALRNEHGACQAVHATWLAADGGGKCSDVENAKLVFGPASGCAIRLSRGLSGLTVEDAVRAGAKGPLAISEGVETGETVAEACAEYRVWAAYSLSNLGNLVLPACVDRVVVLGENDWAKPAAQNALDRGVEKLKRQGRPVAVAFPFGDAGDFNDLVQKKG